MSEMPRSSDYSRISDNAEEIEVTEDEMKAAKSHIYSILMREPMAAMAVLPAIVIGTAPILSSLILGHVLNELAKHSLDSSYDPMRNVLKYSFAMVGVAVLVGLCKFIDSFLWIRIGSLITVKIRKLLFNSMMHLDVTFFDVTPIGGILTLLGEESQIVQDAFGTAKSQQIQDIGQFLTGIILSYAYNWRLALIATAVFPMIFVTFRLFKPSIEFHENKEFESTSAAMTIAEETLSSIRTVRGFNRESKQIELFNKEVSEETSHDVSMGILLIKMLSIMTLIIFVTALVILYYGANLVEKSRVSGSNDFSVGSFFSVFEFVMLGCFGILQLQSSSESEEKAILAGSRILKLSQTKPKLPFDGGRALENFTGHIEFRDVSFKYPTRGSYVLKHVSFEVKPGQIAALVGHSGSGKSTCVQLIERFYDVTEGSILLDGVDIRELDPRWIHKQISLVPQEPALFQISIKDNIKYGVDPSTTDEAVIAAADAANCKKFIEKLPHGFDELSGEKGTSLSGGQRQRIAIARAIIRMPKILITDEATSALDAGSEKKVQIALDNIMKGLTAIVVAHRLSTIRSANIIFVFDAGEIKEIGTHEQLVGANGLYFKLIHRQIVAESNHMKE